MAKPLIIALSCGVAAACNALQTPVVAQCTASGCLPLAVNTIQSVVQPVEPDLPKPPKPLDGIGLVDAMSTKPKPPVSAAVWSNGAETWSSQSNGEPCVAQSSAQFRSAAVCHSGP